MSLFSALKGGVLNVPRNKARLDGGVVLSTSLLSYLSFIYVELYIQDKAEWKDNEQQEIRTERISKLSDQQ